MSQTRPGWRETLEADPLGIAGRRPPVGTPPEPPAEPGRQRSELIQLAVIVAAVIGLGFAAGAGETVLLVLALVLCIVAHESGHFAMAKWAGIKVTQFFVGFGPSLWSVKRGETEYGVKALPLGGYCRIVGMNNLEEVDPADELRTYRHAPMWRRLSVDVAGSAMHFVIAVLVLFAMFFWTGDPGRYLTSANRLPASNPIVEIDGLKTGASPAQAAGFRLGDRIVAVDGRTFGDWAQLSSYIRSHAGQRLDVTVERAGHPVQLFPVPVDLRSVQVAGGAPAPAGGGSGPVGFLGIATSAVVHSGLGASVSHAGGAFVQTSAFTLDAFGHLLSFHGVSSYVHMLGSQKAADTSTTRFASPVAVVRLLHQAGQSGLGTVLWLLAVINISIGIFNLLPLFPLDGARVVVALYEGVRSRRRPYRVDMAKLLPIFYVGLAAILFISASAFFLDLRDLAA